MKKPEQNKNVEELLTQSALREDAKQVERSAKAELLDEIFSWAKVVVFAAVFALLITQFVIVNACVPTGSMEDNIMPNDRIVAFRLSYLLNDPALYDIVIFRYPDDESKLYVKRIVGMPGDELRIVDGKVYLNGSDAPLRDDFIKGEAYGNFGPFTIPEGHYFMMGDNRENSEDSRYWQNKYVAKEKILGKVIFRYFPGFKNLYNL